MSLLGATILTAVATAILAIGAIVTAVLAYPAFRRQSQEVHAIERQVADEQELTRQQAELIKVQTEQLTVLRAQLEDQRKASAAQAEVLELQATELRKSLEERVREAQRRVRAQAQLVFLAETRYKGRNAGPLDSKSPSITASIMNSSSLPIYEAQIYWWSDAGTHDPPKDLGVIMPGRSASSTRTFEFSVDPGTWSADLVFRDADGIVFKRRADGYLIDLVAPVAPGSINAAYRKEGV